MEVDGSKADELKDKGNELFKRARPTVAFATSGCATSSDSQTNHRQALCGCR